MRFKLAAMVGAALVCAPLVCAAGSAQAAGVPADGLQAMRELNIIVLGDMDANHSIEGKVYVGGKLTGNNGIFGTGNTQQGLTPSDRVTLTVGGDATVSNLHINAGSNGGDGAIGPAGATIGGSVSTMNLNAQNATVQVGGTIANTNGSTGSSIQAGGAQSGYLNGNGATVQTNLGSTFTQGLTDTLTAETNRLEIDLKALSAALSVITLDDNLSSITMGGQGPIFNVVDSGAGFALFDIDASLLSSNELNFNVFGSPMPIIINVRGTSATWMMNAVGGYNAALNPWIIWNFVDATSLSIDRMMHGSVLAPYATVTNTGRIEGSLVAAAFNQGAQVHLGAFKGPDFLTTAVPEPATWAMMIMGFGAVGALVRRRRAAFA
ncbi:collagen-binding domain-containing protein [Phenylobacterium sp.]|uniref:collagen-binding domain-containing protein n=1 Tax=Phenylobacterium sp. TaxID=1871053 RepID=UPI00301DFFC4